MRTYGRVANLDGSKSWVVVTTDAKGLNDAVWLTTLCQCLLLNLNESPFFANYGIPGHQAVSQQIPPDYYVAATQRQFSGHFASLLIAKQTARNPTYKVDVITNQGVRLDAMVAK